MLKNHCDANWRVLCSTTSSNCHNYIRAVVDNLNLKPNPDKAVIALSLGDPTVYGNLKPSKESVDALVKALEKSSFNGYSPSAGLEHARRAVAEFLSFNGVKYQGEDVILTPGCSAAIECCITALADGAKKQNILLPRPGFPIARTLAECLGVQVKYYDLVPQLNWQINLEHLEQQIDSKTAAILLINPSNPCGSVYSKAHLLDFVKIVHRYRIPVIADEIYERLSFPGATKFVSIASLSAETPILVCGGLTKRFLVPGWRMGWVLIHDKTGNLSQIRGALNRLTQRTVPTSTLIQGALPDILQNTPASFHEELLQYLSRQATIAFKLLNSIGGLKPFMPEGAMYMLVQVQLVQFPFNNTIEFLEKLMEEQSVFCLPGECFELPGFFRLVLTLPEDMLLEACHRIDQFCNQHTNTIGLKN